MRAVMQIEQQSYPKPWSPGVFTTELAEAKAGRRVYLVAKIDGELVGYGGLMLVVDEGHVSNIAVDPRYRRRRIGARVLAELLWAARERECVAVSLEVRVSNTAARALYERFGFAAEGVRRKYYENVTHRRMLPACAKSSRHCDRWARHRGARD
jgi:[ribosomal protein S18]-alanine N-acetyltransferase